MKKNPTKTMKTLIPFELDGRAISFSNVWYHHQKTTKLGEHRYKIVVPLSEQKLISEIELSLGLKIDERKFLHAAKKYDTNVCNLIQDIIDHEERKSPEIEFDIQWVFNTIKSVEIKNNTLIIQGKASKAVNNY